MSVSPLTAPARRVFENQVFAPGSTDGPFDHFHEPPDAVLVVHHQVTRGQRQRVDGVAPLGRQPLAVAGCAPVAGQVGLGDHHQVGALDNDAVAEWAFEHADDPRFWRGTGFQHDRGRLGFGQPLHHAMRGPGPGGDHRGVPAGADVRTQHREDAVDILLMPTSRRRRPDVQLHGRLVGQLAQCPPWVTGSASRGAYVVQFDEPRPAQLLDVDGCLTF